MVAIEVAAEKATVEWRDGSARRYERVAASQIVRMGDLKRASTLLKNRGRPANGLVDEHGMGKGAKGFTSITTEAVHHARVGCQGEETAVPDANHDEHHEDDGAGVPKDVNQDLNDGLSNVAFDRCLEMLDREEERHEKEEAEDGRHPDGHEHAEGRAPGRVLRFFRKVGGSVKAGGGGIN